MSVRSAWSGSGGGTPEQVHLTWGEDPATTVVVSWVSPGRARRPRVRIGQRVIGAAERRRIDRASGQRVWTYHARVDGLRPGATYGYAVTADNDRGAADPFSATFTTAPGGRARFRFTSFGDLAGPDPARPAPGDSQAAAAVGAVESFQPLFHLLNADPAGRGLGHANQASAAHRPWMPVPGDHP
ncbi:MAG: fibronectin type III domain-containing protein, partial [Nocardiopsaceae bacterium]|nr:fibronectin type III domain-containing protein [Nocardiopsaceae bacterium]